jgi:hypothetical protein
MPGESQNRSDKEPIPLFCYSNTSIPHESILRSLGKNTNKMMRNCSRRLRSHKTKRTNTRNQNNSHSNPMTAAESKSLMDSSASVRTDREVEFVFLGESNANATDDEDTDPGTPRQVGGAAAAGCLAGLVLAGPVIALLTAAGAAAVATSRGKPGDYARHSGDAMADAGDRLKRFDEKHQVFEKSSRWVSKTFRLNKSSSHQESLSA